VRYSFTALLRGTIDRTASNIAPSRVASKPTHNNTRKAIAERRTI